jgi:hypothetical protein
VTIPANVVEIGSNPFADTPNLNLISVAPENTHFRVQGNSLIRNSNNELISSTRNSTIHNSVLKIGARAFDSRSNLLSIFIPEGVTSIESEAFYGCVGLTTITIPNSVNHIGIANIFQHTANLETIIVLSGNTFFRGEGNSLIRNSDNALISGTRNSIIPNSVTIIESGAFWGCTGLTSIIIPSSVTNIGNNAFRDCTGLTSIIIPSSVTSIGDRAFWGCTGLTSIIIPSSITSIGFRVFSGCTGLTSIIIPSSVTSIGEGAFWGCTGLTSIIIPSSVTTIRRRAFNSCTGLTSINIPNSVTNIIDEAFWGCTGLTSIYIPISVTTIGHSAFRNCNSLTIYAEAPFRPSGWNFSWNIDNRPVVWGFVDPLPGQVNLSMPTNEVTGQPIRPTLTWQQPTSGGSITGYLVYMHTSANPFNPANLETNRVATVTGATNTAWTHTSDLLHNTQYHWQVVANNLTGNGTASESWHFTTQPSPPLFRIEPDTFDFVNVLVGETSDPQIFTIFNEGGSDLIIDTIIRTGSDQSQFIISNPHSMPLTIQSSGTRTFTVFFSPTSSGDKSANIVITHNAIGSPSVVTITGNGTVSETDIIAGIFRTELLGNHPNPFNPETVIYYEVPSDGFVSIEIFNIKGQRVKTLVSGYHRSGEYDVVWSGRDEDGRVATSGVYLYRMTIGDRTTTKKMVLLK